MNSTNDISKTLDNVNLESATNTNSTLGKEFENIYFDSKNFENYYIFNLIFLKYSKFKDILPIGDYETTSLFLNKISELMLKYIKDSLNRNEKVNDLN